MAEATITDNKDGTGITASVSGYSTAVLRVSPFTGKHSQSTFTEVATFSGDGSQSVTLAEGPYFAIWQLDGSFAAPEGFRVTDGSVGVHESCLRALREFVLSLSLPGYPTDPGHHKPHKKPIRTLKEFGQNPLGVHYWKLDETLKLADNARNSVVYPVQIALVRGNGAKNIAEADWTLSRQLLISSFTRCPLPAVPEVHTVEVLPSVLYAPLDTPLNVDLQSMIFRCVTELPAVL